MTISRKSKRAKWTRLFSRSALRQLWHRGVTWAVAQFWTAVAVCKLTYRVSKTLPGAMAFVCLYSFTGGPLMAQTYDAHRKRIEREARILKNLGLSAISHQPPAKDKDPFGLNVEGSRLKAPRRHAWDLHKPIEVGEVGRLTGTLRTVEEDIARKQARLGRDPSAAQDFQYLYKQRDTVEHML